MKKAILFFLPMILASQMQAQVINRGKNSMSANTIQETKEPAAFEFTKQNMVAISVTDIVFTNLTIKYEFFSKDGKVGYQIPLSFNLGGVPDTNNYRVGNAGRFLSARNRIFQTGFNLNYYLTGQDKVSPFVGLSLSAGWFNYWKAGYIYVGNTPPLTMQYSSEALIGNNYSLAFHAGLLCNPWETITLSLKGGIGLRRYGTIYQEYTYPFGVIDGSVGFKFK